MINNCKQDHIHYSLSDSVSYLSIKFACFQWNFWPHNYAPIDDCRDLHSRISVTEFSYKLCFLCMHELIPEPVTHIRSRKNYNNISNAKTGMFGLARKLITKCHNRLESTLYNRQGVGILFRGFLSVMSHGQWTHHASPFGIPSKKKCPAEFLNFFWLKSG